MGQQIPNSHHHAIGHHNLRIHIAVMYLPYKFPASAAWRQNAAAAHGYYFLYFMLAGRYHCGNCGVFGAKAHATWSINAYAKVYIAAAGKQSGGNAAGCGVLG